jgi:hypothetical protein
VSVKEKPIEVFWLSRREENCAKYFDDYSLDRRGAERLSLADEYPCTWAKGGRSATASIYSSCERRIPHASLDCVQAQSHTMGFFIKPVNWNYTIVRIQNATCWLCRGEITSVVQKQQPLCSMTQVGNEPAVLQDPVKSDTQRAEADLPGCVSLYICYGVYVLRVSHSARRYTATESLRDGMLAI